MTEFQQGFFTAVALLMATSDQPTMAADIVREAGFDGVDCSAMDDFDKEQLQLLVEQEGLSLGVLKS